MISITKEYNFSEETLFIKSKKNISIENINYACETIGLDKIKTISEYYKQIENILKTNNIKKCLSTKNKKCYIEYLKLELVKEKYYTSYFSDILHVKNKFLEKMLPLYYKDDIIKKPVYKNSTKTGRQSIQSGFNFLTLKKEERKFLKSTKGYPLFEIDFISCEPNFYFNSFLNKNIASQNIYEFIIRKFNLCIEVDKFKNALIAMLYGAGDQTIKIISGIKSKEIKTIKKYMNVNEFKEKIETEFKSNNMFLNFYKRPILDINNPVNYWIQSSVADFCCLAFNQFLEKNKYLNMHAFIHDSIIVSCKENDVEKLNNIKSLHENISNIALPVRIKRIS